MQPALLQDHIEKYLMSGCLNHHHNRNHRKQEYSMFHQIVSDNSHYVKGFTLPKVLTEPGFLILRRSQLDPRQTEHPGTHPRQILQDGA